MIIDNIDNSDVLIDAVITDSQMYCTWLKAFNKTPQKDMILAGPNISHEYPVWPRNHDNFHYPMGMDFLLSKGFTYIRDQAQKIETYGNRKIYLELIYQVYSQIIKVIGDFAAAAKKDNHLDKYEICNNLTIRKPESFIEACQLYWFATIFRINTSTIGRIDQHLYKFYYNDIKKDKITEEKARALIKELLYRYEKRGNQVGDTLQNITLGGKSESGEDLTNDLTYFILEEYIDTQYIEPKINVRVHKNTPKNVKRLIAELQMNGSGNCTIFNDEAIITGLKSYGRPDNVAHSYCADGCSEIILDGFGETAFRYIDCIKAVEHTLFNGENKNKADKKLQYFDKKKEFIDVQCPVPVGKKTGNFISMETFEDFLTAYYEQLQYQVEVVLKKPYNEDRHPIRLFTAATLPGVLETGVDPFSNPECFHTYGLFIGSLGSAVNSVMAVKKLIYDEKFISKQTLLDALEKNFTGYEILQKKCLSVAKFGNDNDEIDSLAKEISDKFASFVAPYTDRISRPILPGLYNHLFHHTAINAGATPDGRRHGDPVGEHLSPTPGTAKKGPSAVINSVTTINTSKQIFGSTLHLNIPELSLNGRENGINILTALNDVFCSNSGCVMNVNILDADVLRKAQQSPELFEDLVVRVWGFSFYFCQLSREMQDHVIARAEQY